MRYFKSGLNEEQIKNFITADIEEFNKLIFEKEGYYPIPKKEVSAFLEKSLIL